MKLIRKKTVMTLSSNNQGFSLIELMIAIVISGVIAAVAWPSYQGYIEKSRNAEAKNSLLNIAALQHQYFSDNREYTNTVNIDGGGGGLGLSQNLGGLSDRSGLSGGALPDPPTGSHLATARQLHVIDFGVDGSGKFFLISRPMTSGSGNIQYSIDHMGTKKHYVVADAGTVLDTIGDTNWKKGWD